MHPSSSTKVRDFRTLLLFLILVLVSDGTCCRVTTWEQGCSISHSVQTQRKRYQITGRIYRVDYQSLHRNKTYMCVRNRFNLHFRTWWCFFCFLLLWRTWNDWTNKQNDDDRVSCLSFQNIKWRKCRIKWQQRAELTIFITAVWFGFLNSSPLFLLHFLLLAVRVFYSLGFALKKRH